MGKHPDRERYRMSPPPTSCARSEYKRSVFRRGRTCRAVVRLTGAEAYVDALWQQEA